jgi:ribosomal protein S18 acetylase RimI-like enzyme
MDITIPAGHVLRAPTAADAGAVVELLRARDAADLGEPEVTVADIEAEWADVDLERDAWVAEEEDGGRLVGYALVAGVDVLVAVHPDAVGRGLGTELRLAAERRARARGARVVRQFVPAANTAARVLLLEAGWWPVHHYFRMLIALKDAPPAPRVLARTLEERDTEQVWHLVQGAYTGVEGYLPQSLEGWRATALDKPGWDPGLSLVLHDAKGILGVAIGEKGDTGQKRVGFVTTLAVAHRGRHRGHGRTLLLLLLDAFRRRRLRFAEAAVHGPTAAAARLFESVGMTAARRSERWEKVLGV